MKLQHEEHYAWRHTGELTNVFVGVVLVKLNLLPFNDL